MRIITKNHPLTRLTIESYYAPLLPTPTHPIPCNGRVSGFVGQYEHQMDEKGRVSLPSAFRREADSDRFVLLQWEPDYLTLFTASKWADVQQRLLEFRRGDAQSWNQVRLIVSAAVEVSPDKQGRILVPAGLQDAAGLAGTVLLSGNIDRVELWDPARYRRQVVERAGDLEKFAHRLFG